MTFGPFQFFEHALSAYFLLPDNNIRFGSRSKTSGQFQLEVHNIIILSQTFGCSMQFQVLIKRTVVSGDNNEGPWSVSNPGLSTKSESNTVTNQKTTMIPNAMNSKHKIKQLTVSFYLCVLFKLYTIDYRLSLPNHFFSCPQTLQVAIGTRTRGCDVNFIDF